MREYIIRRLLLLPLIIIGVSFLTFVSFRFIPGSVAHLKCGLECTPEVVEAIEHQYGLDRPMFEQYGEWLGVNQILNWVGVYNPPEDGRNRNGILQGNLGESFLTNLSVGEELGRRFPITLQLMVMSLFWALLLGIPPGILSAVRPGTVIDFVVRFVSVFWLSIPSFYLAILIITFGGTWFGWSPPNFGTGRAPGFFEDPVTNLETFFWPSIVLALGIAAVIMRLTRSSMLEVLRNDYIRTAYAKGLRERMVVFRHAVKNAMIPVATIVGLQIGALIGGSVLVEAVFALNGIGRYLVEAVVSRDLLVVQSLVLIFAVAYVTINLLVDLSYAWLDPRIRYS
jgi:peptide/nickel transport system permease protein